MALSKHNIAYRTPCQGGFWGFPQVFWGLCWRGRKAGGVRRGQTRCRVWRAFPWVMPCCGCWLEGLVGLVVGSVDRVQGCWRGGCASSPELDGEAGAVRQKIER